jgi:trimeric autotransporter adhesin
MHAECCSGRRQQVIAIASLLLSMLVFQFTPANLRANPSGEDVVAGQAEFERSGSTLTVTQGSQNVIINWQDFSIGADELTRFLQPDSTAAALNRVISNNPSYLLGTLEANGNIYLINQNGILVGSGAVIDTNSFIASTLDVSDEAFMAGGDLTFLGDSQAAIQNLGTITADGGDIFLIARQIDNSGTLSATQGTVGLLAGAEVLLAASGENRGSVRIGTSNDSIEDGAAIKNSGEVKAAMATLDATGSMYSVAINNEGTIRATGADTSGGRVRLTAGGGDIHNSGEISAQNADGSGGAIEIAAGSNDDGTATVYHSGTIDASGYAEGATGGRVEVTGDRVALLDDSLIDASGDAGGGDVYVGGGFQGQDPDIQNAQRTHVAGDAEIKADAVTEGDGGEVIVWADGDTRFYGRISATGGAEGGDGGFAEVSGKDYLDFQGIADLSADYGMTGTLLLDPTNINIVDQVAANDQGVDTSSSPFITEDPAPDAESTLTWATILANLTTADLEITTVGGFDAGQDGNITIVDSPDQNGISGSYSHANDLTLTTAASGGIFFNANVVNTGTGGLVMNAGSGGININTANIEAGFLTFNSAAGNVTLQTNTTLTGNTGDITFTANTAVGGAFDLVIDAANDVFFGSGANVSVASLDLDSANGVVTLRSVTASTGNIDVNAGLTGTINLNATGGTLNSTSANVILAADTVNVNQTSTIISSNAAGAVDLSGVDTLALGSNQLTLTSDDLSLPASSITGDAVSPANLILQPLSTGTNISLNTADATLAFGANVAGNLNTLLANGEFIVTIGRTNSTGDLTIGDGTAQTIALNNRYVFRMGNINGSGDIEVTNNTDLAGIATGDPGINSLEFRAGAQAGTGTFRQGTGTIIRVDDGVGGTGMGGLLFSSNFLVLDGGPNSIQTLGNITFQPSNDATTIGINGGAGDFDFTDFALLQPGFASLTIGSATGTGTVNINAGNFSNSTIIQSGGGGVINVNGLLTGDADAFLILNAGASGTIVLNDNIVTEDAAIGLTAQNVQIGAANILLDSTDGAPSGGGGGDITINANIIDPSLSTNRNLTINAGAEDIFINGTVGTAANNRLNLLTLNSTGDKWLSPATATAVRANRLVTNDPGTGIATGDGQTLVGGDILTFGTGASGGIEFNDNVVLQTDVLMNTAGGTDADLVVEGTLTAPFGEDLTVNVGTGSAFFNGQIGGEFTPLGDMLITSDDTIEFNADVFANALQTRNVAANAAAGTTRIGGDITTFQNNFSGNSQLYNTAETVIHGADVTLTSNETNIRFLGAVEGDVDNANDLTVNVGTGTMRFDQAVGQTTSLGDVELISNNSSANQGIRIASDWRSASLVTSGVGITRLGGGTGTVLSLSTPAEQTITTTQSGGQIYNTEVVLYAEHTIFDTSDNGNFTAGGPLLFPGGITLTVNDGNDLTVITGDEDFATGPVGAPLMRVRDFEIFSRGTSTLNGDIYARNVTINDDTALPAGYVTPPGYTGEGITVLNGITIDTLEHQTYNSAVQLGTDLNTLLANTNDDGIGSVTFNYTLNGTGVGNNNLVIDTNGEDVTFSGSEPGGDPAGNIYVFNAGDIILNENLITPANNALRARSFAAEDFNDFIAQGGELETTGSSTTGALDYGAINPGAQIAGDFGINIIADNDILVGADDQTLQSRLETLNGNALLLDAVNIMVQAADGTNSSTDAQIISSGLMDLNAANLLQVRGGMGTATGTEALIRSAGDMTLTADIINVLGGDGTGGGNVARIDAQGTGADAQRITALTGDFTIAGSDADGVDGNSAVVEASNADGTQTIIVGDGDVLGGNLIVRGGDGTVDGVDSTNNTASLLAEGIQNITVEQGDMTVRGGDGADSAGNSALVQSIGAQTIVIGDGAGGGGNFLVRGGHGGDGNIAQVIGNQDHIVEVGDYTVAGGDGLNASAEVISTGTGDDAQTITILEGNLLVRGADVTGGGSFARVYSPDGQIIVVGNGDVLGGDMTVRGGAGTGNDNYAEIVADGHQSITVEQGELLVAGGDGDGSDSYGAIIKTDVEGGFQEIDVQNNNMTVRGGTGTGTGNYGLVSSATDQVIDVSLVLSVLGGASQDNEAGIFAQDDQFITVANAGNEATGLLIESGDGQDADAFIDSEGVEQTVVLEQGDLIVRANQDPAASSEARISLQADNSDPDTAQNIIVGFTVDGDGNLDVQNTGELQLFGGAGTGESAFISTSAQSQNITAADAIRLTGGIAGSVESRAIIGQQGAVGNQTVTVVSDDVSGDITINGGAGTDGVAGILHIVDDGIQTIDVARDLIVQGGDGNITVPTPFPLASALIASTGTEQNLTIANDLVMDGGAGDDATALIAIIDGEQTILVGNDATLTGGTGTDARAYIVADGLQTVATARHLSINGGDGTNAFAGIEANDDQLILVGFEYDEVADDFVASGQVANLTLTGGDGGSAVAFIQSNSETADAQRIILSDGDLTVQGNEDNTNTDGMAFIVTTHADSGQYIEVNGDVGAGRGNLFVFGGEASIDDAFISANGQSQEIVVANRIEVVAGNDDAYAFIESAGTQDITAGTGMEVTGGTVNSNAFVTSTDAQTINVLNGGELTVTGGGDDSEAFIYSESTQNINVDGYVTVSGGTGEECRCLH